jgi:hypothetical protein
MALFNKSENWWLRLGIVLIALGLLSILAADNRQNMDQTKLFQTKIDSLNDELFNEKSYNGRLELTIDHFIEKKKIDSTEFYQWMDHETE